jgi:hypothetical protein
VDCVGTSASVLTNRECYINLATLTSAPYNLQKDDPVIAKIVSTNVYGDSIIS